MPLPTSDLGLKRAGKRLEGLWQVEQGNRLPPRGRGRGRFPRRSEEGSGPPLPSGPPPCVLRQRWARRREPIGRAGSAGD